MRHLKKYIVHTVLGFMLLFLGILMATVIMSIVSYGLLGMIIR